MKTPRFDPVGGLAASLVRRRYAQAVRLPRRLERLILGTMMSLVALLAERRVVKGLGKRR